MIAAAILLLCLLLCLADSLGMKIAVTGAAGRTGSQVFKKLLDSEKHQPLAIVRTEKSMKKLFKMGGTTDNVVVVDVTDRAALEKTLRGCDGVILCTSAVPKIKILSLIKVLALKLFRKTARPQFYFIENGDPYNVDYLGAVNQIEAAKSAGLSRFVFLSSMGGTQPENFLNSIGKVEGDDKSGNILLWKRKAEEALIASGMTYTIVHPGGLTDKPGAQSEIVMGFDDQLLKGEVRSIPRADVAEVCVQALDQPAAENKAFDIAAKIAAGAGSITKDWAAFFSKPGSCAY